MYTLDLKSKDRPIRVFMLISMILEVAPRENSAHRNDCYSLEGGNCVLMVCNVFSYWVEQRLKALSKQQIAQKAIISSTTPPPPQPGQESSLWYVYKDCVQSRFKGLKLGGFNHLF